jgi:hypothetical protein
MNYGTKAIVFLFLSQCNSMAFSASPFDPHHFPMIKLDLKNGYWQYVPDEFGGKKFVRIPTLPNKKQRKSYQRPLNRQSFEDLSLLRTCMQQINLSAENPLEVYRSYASIQSINKVLKKKVAS